MKLVDWVYVHGNSFIENREKNYQTAFIGNTCQVDERSQAAEQYCQSISEHCFIVDYIESKLHVLDEEGEPFSLESGRLKEGEIIIDATTVDVPELLKIIEWLNQKKYSFDVCYFEPEKYVNKKNSDVCDDSYVISNDGGGINFIPPFVCSASKSDMVVSLGFEGHRFGSIIESEEYPVEKFYALVGVPAFKLGMEKISLLMNKKALEDSKAEILISGANDPVEAYRCLGKLKSICCKTPLGNKTIILAPFGTKPVALAMCVFAVNNRGTVGMIYDFAQRKDGRSSGMGMAHKWSFKYGV